METDAERAAGRICDCSFAGGMKSPASSMKIRIRRSLDQFTSRWTAGMSGQWRVVHR